MPWGGKNFNWDRASIINNTPSASGVYAIWRPNQWIYVGETNDLQRRLLEHFDGGNHRITQASPTGFGFELVSGDAARINRQNALILELKPSANQILG